MRPMMLVGLLGAMALLAPTTHGSTFLKKSLNEWRDALEKAERADHRRSAAFALGQIGEPVAIDALVACVQKDKDAGVREMAARAVGDIVIARRRFDPELEPKREWEAAGKALDAALKDGDPRVRRSAAYALGAFGEMAAQSRPALRAALRDKVPTVRQNAAWAIGKMGDPGEETVRELCSLLGDDSPLVRRLTAGALGEVRARQKRKSPEVAHALIKMLETEKDDAVCRAGLGALATMADASLQKDAAKIYPLLESKDAETARATAFVLANMGGEPATRAVVHLRKALADPDPAVQTIAAASLANAGVAAAPAVEALADALGHSHNNEVRRNCVVALGLINKALRNSRDPRLDRTAPPALAALMNAMKVKGDIKDDALVARAKEQIREDATEAIGNIGYPHIEKAFPLIAELLAKDANELIRQRCVWALFDCRELDRYDDLKKAVVGILDETSDAGLLVRYDAARYLARTYKDKAPERVTEVLLHMLGNTMLKVFYGSGTTVDGIGDEAKRGGARVTTRTGGDGRYMAADALAWIGPKLKGNDKVAKALEAAAKEKDAPELNKAASRALEAIKK
jgi:HEAT repeat protein